MQKTRVAIIFGGKSSEHEISIKSARNIFEALDCTKYDPILIGIGKNGEWYRQAEIKKIDSKNSVRLVSVGNKVQLVGDGIVKQDIDVAFPILHGTNGEDGTIQGLLKLANVPFVGAGVIGAAVGMDKDVMKRLLRDAKIPIAKFLVFRKNEKISFEKVKKSLSLPFFVKPANNGSSVGVSKVKSEKEFDRAIREAFKFDKKIIIEEAISGREIECSVLGNDNPVASIPGEILTKHEFYSYEAKYLDENGTRTEIPAKLTKIQVKRIQELAIQTFKVLECEGMGRVDMFLDKRGKILVNEINTIPGFTNISMYPAMWQASGMSYSKLIDKLIKLAIERFNSEKMLSTSYTQLKSNRG